MIIAIDFDGTIVEHEYPKIGKPVPNALRVIKRFIEEGNKIILYTMRSNEYLEEAIKYLKDVGIELWGVNENKEQSSWTNSRKIYAHMYIDDASIGCPLMYPKYKRPFVNWRIIEKLYNERMNYK